MIENLIDEAENLKRAFTELVDSNSSYEMAKANEEQVREILVDIKMMLYTYDPEMPLTLISRTFPDALKCLIPEAFGLTKAQTSDVVVKTLDCYIKHLRQKQKA